MTSSGNGDGWVQLSSSSFRSSPAAGTVFPESKDDDEEAVKWAALEKLPTYDRLRKGILKNVTENGGVVNQEVDVTKLGILDRQKFIQKILHVAEEGNERLLLKLRERIDRVGIDIPKIEVRFEHLNAEAKINVGSRALPTLYNFTVNVFEELLCRLRLLRTKKRVLTILHDVSGVIKPSRMTLLLGPPGSGKTTLLLALAGKLPSDLRASGRVTYNGSELTEFVPQKTSAYISQYDLQTAEMTVRETLDFCGRCQGVGTRHEMMMELMRREREAGIKPDPDIDIFMKATAVEGAATSLLTDYTLKILGLDICADISVGNEMRRGISGGQKKRLTTGEMLVGPAKALFMDEISTGLDTSTTFQIVKCLQQSVHVMDGTMVVSLLQPAPETFELFDDIVLLSEGQIVYQGPRDLVVDFFEHMGFKCPERKSVADFLQEVTSKKDQAQYWANNSQPYLYVPVAKFAEAFSSFHVGHRVANELSIPHDKLKSHPASLATQKYGLNKWELFKACFEREWLLMKRNSFVYVFKTFQISLIATVTMTAFLRTEMHHNTIEDGNLYLGALFYALLNVLLNGLAEMSMTVARLPVFYKQRDMLFYPPWAFSLPTWVLKIPLSLLESGIWVVLSYYVIGFAPEAGRFFRHFLVLFFVHQAALGLFRFIAAVGQSMVIVNIYGVFVVLIIFVTGGFVISKDNIPVWWIWGYWISPLMYGQNAISINEFLAPRWHSPNSDPGIGENTVGKAILKARGLFVVSYWYWIGIGALAGFVLLFNMLYTIALSYLDPIGRPQPIVSEKALAEKHANRTGEAISSPHANTRSPSMESSGSTREGIRLPSKPSSPKRQSDQLEAVPEENDLIQKRGRILPFQPLSIAFEGINYYVDMPAEMKQQGTSEDRLQLLRDVSGAFRPGVLTALVGVSGAGKTTLMDVLAGRKTSGYIEGDIYIAGYPKKQETFARISGYCEQTDIHSPHVTVRESLIYSAWLRLPNDVNSQTRMIFVNEVMDLVELSSIKDALVGLPGVSGLSTEQRKRLTVAVELVANPSIIFMDEPTSGLDARAAAIVMRTVRNTVKTGRTVLCTIHQPSIDIFEAFDELLLMKQGGQIIYAGPLGHQSRDLIKYFEDIPGVPKIKEKYNPATWMLDISAPSVESRLGVDFADIYRNSALYQRNKALIKEMSSPPLGSDELHFSTTFAQNFVTQWVACLWKQHKSYWRNPEYNVMKLFFTTITALLLGSVFWNLGSKTGTQQDLFNIMGCMYAAIIFLGVSNASAIQPIVAVQRTVFYREKAAGMYSALPYALAQVVIEIPYALTQTILYAVIVYAALGFEWVAAKFFWFVFFMFFAFLIFTCYGMMCVALTPSLHFSVIISSTFYGFWNLFSGFLIPRTKIAIWWRWYYWCSPIAWTLYGIITSQFGDLNEATVVIPGAGAKIVSEYIRDYFGYHYSFLKVVAVMHVVFVLLFAIMFAVCIKVMNFQKR